MASCEEGQVSPETSIALAIRGTSCSPELLLNGRAALAAQPNAAHVQGAESAQSWERDQYDPSGVPFARNRPQGSSISCSGLRKPGTWSPAHRWTRYGDAIGSGRTTAHLSRAASPPGFRGAFVRQPPPSLRGGALRIPIASGSQQIPEHPRASTTCRGSSRPERSNFRCRQLTRRPGRREVSVNGEVHHLVVLGHGQPVGNNPTTVESRRQRPVRDALARHVDAVTLDELHPMNGAVDFEDTNWHSGANRPAQRGERSEAVFLEQELNGTETWTRSASFRRPGAGARRSV